jgi:hypothetical protein
MKKRRRDFNLLDKLSNIKVKILIEGKKKFRALPPSVALKKLTT